MPEDILELSCVHQSSRQNERLYQKLEVSSNDFHGAATSQLMTPSCPEVQQSRQLESIFILNKSYVYSPLGKHEFRLLSLLPGPSNSPISVSLQHKSERDSKRAYQALSYIWGNSNNKLLIICSGIELLATVNSFVALRERRSENEPSTMWIDAICITQEDLQERNQQVSLMNHIYRDADVVIIWGGEQNEDSDLAIQIIQDWTNTHDERESSRTLFIRLRNILTEGYAYLPDNFVLRPWFSALLDFQKDVSTTKATIICGTTKFKWKALSHTIYMDYRTFTFLRNLVGKRIESYPVIVIGSLRRHRSIGSHRSLLYFLHSIYRFHTIDPHDQTFALLGLVEVNFKSLFEPRYELAVRDVYIACTVAVIKDSGNRSTLASTNREILDSRFPPSCPNWQIESRAVLEILGSKYHNLSAAFSPNFSSMKMDVRDQPILEGALLEAVSEVHELQEFGISLVISVSVVEFVSVWTQLGNPCACLEKRNIEHVELGREDINNNKYYDYCANSCSRSHRSATNSFDTGFLLSEMRLHQRINTSREMARCRRSSREQMVRFP